MKTEIKDRLKQALEIRGMMQSELAEKAHIDKGQLSSYISGKYKPRQNNIDALSSVLNVNEAWLMGFDVPMERGDSATTSPCDIHFNTKDETELIFSYRALITENQKRCLAYAKNLLATQKMEQELLAAHARTDIKVTAEDIQHDLDLMDDDGWEE